MVKKDRFYNMFHQLEAKQKQAVLICYSLTFCIIFLVAGLIFYAITPKPVYYINGASGLANPVRNYKPIAEEFAKLFVSNITNFTGENVKDVFEEAKKMCSPSYLAKIRPVLAKEIDSAQKSRMNSASSILFAETKMLSQNRYLVSIKIFRTIWVGREKISEKTYRYEVIVKKVAPTTANPIGLVVDNVEVKESNI